MKIAIAAVFHLRLPAWPHQTGAAFYRMAGLAIAIGVPTLFWTFALALATKGTGVVIGAPALAAFGVIIAAWCLVGAALVMGASGSGQADSGIPKRGRKC
jgi:hypothetical protein